MLTESTMQLMDTPYLLSSIHAEGTATPLEAELVRRLEALAGIEGLVELQENHDATAEELLAVVEASETSLSVKAEMLEVLQAFDITSAEELESMLSCAVYE